METKIRESITGERGEDAKRIYFTQCLGYSIPVSSFCDVFLLSMATSASGGQQDKHHLSGFL